jgi:hypothetical protein
LGGEESATREREEERANCRLIVESGGGTSVGTFCLYEDECKPIGLEATEPNEIKLV